MVSSGGDLQLEGEITNYDLTPQAVTENAYASQTFSGYKDFSSDRMLTDVQDELIQQITDELVDQIFNATVANW